MTTVKTGGRTATTRWSVLEEYSFGSLLQVDLETGRTHQIRVHLEALRAPILGDEVYTKFRREAPSRELSQAINALGRQALHATTLSFIHPITSEELTFTAPLPAELIKLQELLRSV